MFDIKIKHDGKAIQKAKFDDIDDLDPIVDGLKEKFGSNKRKNGRC